MGGSDGSCVTRKIETAVIASKKKKDRGVTFEVGNLMKFDVK